jgi:N-acetylmuramoyl-L-alanine amidase
MIILIKKKKVIYTVIAAIFIFISIGSLKVCGIDINKTEKKNKIVIDAGHGGEDPGAVSFFSELKEKDANLEIALKLKEGMEKEGYEVIMTRTEDKLIYDDSAKSLSQKRKQDLMNRKKIMDESNANVVVSIHLNKFSIEKYRGAQMIYSIAPLESRELAYFLQKSFKDNIDLQNDREPQLRDGKDNVPIIIKNSKVPTVIVECGFISNKEEEKNLRDSIYREKIVYAIKIGIKNYVESKTENN